MQCKFALPTPPKLLLIHQFLQNRKRQPCRQYNSRGQVGTSSCSFDSCNTLDPALTRISRNVCLAQPNITANDNSSQQTTFLASPFVVNK